MKNCFEVCILGLGSNKGDSVRQILDAIEDLSVFLRDIRRASLYETEPIGVTDQNNFINTCISGSFSGGPEELLEKIQAIERKYGRDRRHERRWGERSLDIDIILMDDLILPPPSPVEIPHPCYTERQFVLIPLLELLPDCVDPQSKRPLRAILEELEDQGVKKIMREKQ
jgi:2-amino-4-hydroxy-6-hydroxymethyldihydropteridine diphosphokinase